MPGFVSNPPLVSALQSKKKPYCHICQFTGSVTIAKVMLNPTNVEARYELLESM